MVQQGVKLLQAKIKEDEIRAKVAGKVDGANGEASPKVDPDLARLL